MIASVLVFEYPVELKEKFRASIRPDNFDTIWEDLYVACDR